MSVLRFSLSVISALLLSACGGGGGGSGASTGGGTSSATVPGPPSALSAIAGDRQVTLQFSAPSQTGGAAVSGYLAQCSSDAHSASAQGSGSPLVVTGLINGLTWRCTVSAQNSVGTGAASTAVSVVPQTQATAFDGNILLGAPTASRIRLNLLSGSQSGLVSLEYGTTPGQLGAQTPGQTLEPNQPLLIELNGLQANTRYHYRVRLERPGLNPVFSEPYSFQTARPAGSRFRFTLQSDSHLDENTDLAVYQRTLQNIRDDVPDFHLDLGDTFMTEKHAEPFTSVVAPAPDEKAVQARYAYERKQFATFSSSVPLFLANGNHDGELGWLEVLNPQAVPAWATKARRSYFLNPIPDAFYSGDDQPEPVQGQRAAWYAWHWGDALFIVLDPYWNTRGQPSRDPWAMTLGERQYQWLSQTLANSGARFKFVFLHNLVGGLDGQMRGGVEAAPYFEWGGQHSDGSKIFASKRPGWALPIHDLLVKHRVSAVFHGHDHVYVHQTLDGIVYQALPQPSARNTQNGAEIAKAYHYDSGRVFSSAGHVRITVSPEQVTGEYVRAWLPAQETANRKNAQIDDQWQIPAF